MRIGVYQFSGSEDMEKNAGIICQAIRQASACGVRLLVFQECALYGYPPVETKDIAAIDLIRMQELFQEIENCAKTYGIYTAVGTIRREGGACYNSLRIIDPLGKTLGYYDKNALWGWDLENFRRGGHTGIFGIDGIRVGFRICFDVRFPECFRELYRQQVSLCFVSFCDVSKTDLPERYEIIRSHLRTRAVENVMTVVSVNSVSSYQTAPTAIFDPNGGVIAEAPKNEPYMLVYDYTVPELSFGMRGRIENSNYFLGL